jgi:hypothetical protein
MLVALLSAVGLAALGLIMFFWRLAMHEQIPRYPWITDWLGHGGAHAAGMILMATVMLGWVSRIGPRWAYLLAYGALAILFALRTVMAREV